jgi:magnesium transporter
MSGSNITKLITTNVPTCNLDNKIADVKKDILKNIKDFETVNYIYVLDEKKKLHGVLSIKELFERKPTTYIKDYPLEKVVKAYAHTDKERIAHLALHNNIKSIPIVSRQNDFLGIIASDDILRILDSEATEDLMMMTGIIPNENLRQDQFSVFKSFMHRAPWIIFGLFGGLLAARLIASFEGILEKQIVLAAFIPLVAYVSNAVGAQTQTLYIRDLAVTNNSLSVIKYGLRQLGVSVFIGLACWFTIFLISIGIWNESLLGMVVGFSVFAGIIVATFFAIAIPYILLKLNKDPGVGSGPFTTIIQDMLSILIYLLIASFFVV